MLWAGRVPTEQWELAQDILVRLSKFGTSNGNTFFNPLRGQLKFRTSVDLSMVTLKAEKMSGMLEQMLDPFSKKIGAMQSVLNGTTAADAAVESYANWVQERTAKIMRSLLGGDPSLN